LTRENGKREKNGGQIPFLFANKKTQYSIGYQKSPIQSGLDFMIEYGENINNIYNFFQTIDSHAIKGLSTGTLFLLF
jgi:hypothetical protein